MISGFNTDIEYNGTVYHVQTEDKGAPSRIIISLVYDRGTILASKRVSYEDLVSENFDEKKLADRVSRQHKLICAAVKAGRMSELKEMTAKSAVAGAKAKADALAAVVEAHISVPAVPVAPVDRVERAVHAVPLKIAMVETERVIRVVPPDINIESDRVQSAQPVHSHHEPVIEAVSIIEDEIMPAEAVEVVSELSGQERPSNTKLSLELLGDLRFKGGDRRTVNIMICRGTDRKVVADAQIMIKVLGSSFRPVIFHAKSDSNGLAKVHLQLPHFQAGRAALLVRVMSAGEEVELRKVVTPG